MKFIYTYCLVVLSFYSFSQFNDVTYDLNCSNNTLEEQTISFFSSIEKSTLSSFGSIVSIEEEINEGKHFFELVKIEYSLDENVSKNSNLNEILKSLVRNLPNGNTYNYSVHLVKSKELNAFTLGGYIYITNGMYDFCKSNNQIALIIAHEIAHNELKHINEELKRIKSLQNVFGDKTGNIISSVGKLAIISFNQPNEVYSDMYGVDLLQISNYSICEAITIWKQLNETLGNNEEIPLVFSSHPYSLTRYNCLLNHINENYQINCK